MEPNSNNNDIELVGIEIGEDDPVHLDNKMIDGGKDFDLDPEGFDVGVDMRDLGDEEDSEGEADDPEKDDTDGDDASEPDDKANEEDKGDAPEDLGEFKADDPELVEKFNSRYFTDGTLSLQTLYNEFESNFAGGNARLNAGTEDFLASRGIPKEALEANYEAYQVRAEEAKRVAKDHDNQLTELAGGKDNYAAAVKWAKESGTYSEAAVAAYNKVMRGGDLQAKKDALELLMARYGKANPEKRRDEPRRDATKGRAKPSSPAGKPFANKAEYQAAVKAAGNDMNKLRVIDARARLSGF